MVVPDLKTFLIFCALVMAGLIGNVLNIDLFYGVDLVFGSIASLVAVRLLGISWGTAAAILIASYTVFIWGHAYAVIIYSFEALWVGLWIRRNNYREMTFPAVLYWSFIGMPLAFLFYFQFMDMGLKTTILIALKNGINGVFCALVASLFVTYVPLSRWIDAPPGHALSLRTSLFHLLATLSLVGVLVMLTVSSRQEFETIERKIETDLQTQLREAVDVLDLWRREFRTTVTTLANEALEHPPQEHWNHLQNATEILHRAAPDMRRLRLLDREGTAYTFSPPQDVDGQPNIGRNYSDRMLFRGLQETLQPTISNVVLSQVNTPTLVLTYGVPVIRNSVFDGYAEGVIDLDNLGVLLARGRGAEETVPDVTVLDSVNQVIVSTKARQTGAPVTYLPVQHEQVMRRFASGILQWVPPEVSSISSAIKLWGHSIYSKQINYADNWDWTLLAEVPAAPYQNQLYSLYLTRFVVGLGLVLFALLVSHVLSKRLAAPLSKLAELTSRLTGTVQGKHERLDWPVSGWIELNRLTANFRQTAESLEESFQSLHTTNEELSTLIKASPLAIFSLDERGSLSQWNETAERMLGWKASEVIGGPPPFIPRDQIHWYTDMQQQVLNGQRFTDREIRLLRKDGTLIDTSMSTAPLRDPEGRVRGSMAMLADLTERKRIAAEVTYRTEHDLLTGLLNRHAFGQELEDLLADKNRQQHAFLYLDLDQFKLINDTCGHPAGDVLLRQVAHLLEQHVSHSDVVARLGGDEFGILLVKSSPTRSLRVGRELVTALRNFRFDWDNRHFDVKGSIGLVMLDETIANLEEAFVAADHTCYIAKEQGRDQIQIYRPSDQDIARRSGEMAWVHRIRQALKDDLFRLHRQAVIAVSPQSTLGQSRVEHYEVLIRMQDDEGNPVAPDLFIPAAERYNLMPDVDRWTIRNVCALQQRERAASPDGHSSHYAINLSGNTLGSENLMGFVREQFEIHGTDPSTIGFEITETAAMANFSRAVAFVDDVRSMGCKVYLDDFGSGLSSFGYLRTLRVDALKIDRIFIQNITSDSVDYAMVDAIYRIGHVSGLSVVAEGVESAQTLRCLSKIGIDLAQGYAIHRPEPCQS